MERERRNLQRRLPGITGVTVRSFEEFFDEEHVRLARGRASRLLGDQAAQRAHVRRASRIKLRNFSGHGCQDPPHGS